MTDTITPRSLDLEGTQTFTSQDPNTPALVLKANSAGQAASTLLKFQDEDGVAATAPWTVAADLAAYTTTVDLTTLLAAKLATSGFNALFDARLITGLAAAQAAQAVYQNMAPEEADSELTNASGVILYTGIRLVAGQIVSNISFVTGGTAADTPTVSFFGLYSSDGTTLTRRAVSADGGAGAIAANSVITKAMASPYTIPTSGLYYAASLIVSTTNPTLVGLKPFNAAMANIVTTNPSHVAKTYATLAAQVTLVTPQALAGVTASNLIPYVLVS